MAHEEFTDASQWTVKQRRDLVLKLLREEITAEEAAKNYGLTAREIEELIEISLSAIEDSLAYNSNDILRQSYIHTLAKIGLLFGESLHLAKNRLGMAKVMASNIRAGYYDNDLDKIKSIADQIIQNINFYMEQLDKTQAEDLNISNNSKIDLHKLLKSAIQRKKGIFCDLKLEYLAGDPELNAPKQQLEQVFLVLLQNALDAMSHGEGVITIKTEEIEKKNIPFLKVSISDTGRGIPKNAQNEIFSFSKKYQPKGKSQRLGLGLSWVNSFLLAYGGEITYETLPDKGTTFYVFLPKDFKSELN